MSLKSDRAIINFLNRHLWKTDPISAPALQYGIKHEKIARDSYKSLINSDSSMMVVETGFWVSSIDPELACSPDGLIMDHDEPTIYGILEIKCPKSLEYERISNFNEKLTKQQKKNFFLEINDENKITLKTHTNTITKFKLFYISHLNQTGVPCSLTNSTGKFDFNPKHMLRILKRTVSMRRFF